MPVYTSAISNTDFQNYAVMPLNSQCFIWSESDPLPEGAHVVATRTNINQLGIRKFENTELGERWRYIYFPPA